MPAEPRFNPEVSDWFATYENPHKQLMLDIRAFILDVDERVTECIKWKTPTFVCRGNIASFNPRSKRHVSLLFHAGATIPGDHPHLHGGAGTAAYMSFADPADFDHQRDDLAVVLRDWISMKESTGR
jgi:hypothetical protein